MKILQINSIINSGSTGRIAEGIGEKVIGRDGKSYIAYGRNDRPSQSEKIRIGNKYDILWHGLETRLFDNHGFASRQTTCDFIRQIEQIKPDIIHLHNIHGYYLNIEILFNYLSKAEIPVVWTLHDCWAFTGHCTHFSFVECEKWKTHCYQCPQKNQYPASSFLDRSFKNYKIKQELFTSVNCIKIVAVSNWLKSVIADSFLKKYTIETIYNGIDLSIFAPKVDKMILAKYNLTDKYILLTVAGKWTERKGLYHILRLSNMLYNNEVILMVGVSDDLIKKLPKNIIGVTRTENINEMARLFATSDIFINLTLEDSFPTVNIESLASGTPVITYNTGGSPEAISSETGLVVDQGDLEGVRAAINIVKKNGKDHYSSACRDRAVSMFDKNDRYEDYIRLYEELLNK